MKAEMELLACDGQGVCGVCKLQPPEYHLLQCDSCSCFWHVACLRPPLTSVLDGRWKCPDCDLIAKKSVAEENKLVKRIRAIEADATLDESEKAMRRQQLLSGVTGAGPEEDGFCCMICSKPLNLPVTTPCGHNLCLTCMKRCISICSHLLPVRSRSVSCSPPPSKMYTKAGRSLTKSLQRKLTKEFSCGICKNVLQRTLSTPCGHDFCQSCLVERVGQRNLKFCPKCHHDITEFMVSPAVNMDMDEMIDSLKDSIAKESEQARKAAELVEEALGGVDKRKQRWSAPESTGKRKRACGM